MFKRFLKIVVILLSIHSSLATGASPSHSYKVIIVGAGVAGLEAAHYLQAHGITDYIILEARDRVGGRAWTINWNNIDIDLGATWIHGGVIQNPLMKLVAAGNIPTQEVNFDNSELYDANGKLLSDETEAGYDNTYHQFQALLKEKNRNISKNSNLSISDVAVEFIKAKHFDKPQQYGFLFKVSDQLEEEYAADIKDLSALWYDSETDIPGKDRVPLHGYKDIVNGLAKDVQSHIQLNQVVKKIDYQNSQFVTVTTANGKQFNAQNVICTLPVGVLKKGSVEFIPQLPTEKREAIEHMNMGTMNKVIMLFPQVFWGTPEYISYVPPAYWSGKEWVNKGKWTQFYNMDTFIHKPVLFALVAGDFAVDLENQTDEQTIQGAMTILHKIYGPNIPNPVAYKITRWGKDPYSEGSYASLRPGALEDGEDYVNLAKPIGKHLYFAGEATNELYPATVYGAYLSGDRAAKEVLNQKMD